ncbi:MAG TPA: hypothetical protein DD490_24530 [Acidobacteria bacterium]|nr:hypothetical protein [Acidobacteriota bacterium]
MEESRRCILVVDDEADFRRVMKLHFEDLGDEVLEAADGVEALEVFAGAGGRIELVITDIAMPRMDGERLIRELRRRVPHLSIIGITGHTELRDVLRAVDQGAYFYLYKPLDPWPVVERLVDNAIHMYRVRKKELEISRLLRTYIVETSEAPLWDPDLGHVIRLDVAALPIERSTPSGDFVEWFSRSPGEVRFYVSDSSGHGDLLPSFLACVCNMALHRSHQGGRPTLEEALLAMDRAVGLLHAKGGLDKSRYVSLFLGQIDLAKGELEYVGAGHPAAFLLTPGADGEAPGSRRLGSTFRLLGPLQVGTPAALREPLRPGDLLFVYTDGASELLQGDDRMVAGWDRLEAFLHPHLHLSAEEIVREVAAKLHDFAGATGLPDDTTLLAIKVLDGGVRE